MNGLVQCGWKSPDGVLFPLAYYAPQNPGNHAAHKAEWEPVYTVAKEVQPVQVLTPTLKALADDFARSTSLDRQSLALEQAAA